MGPLARAGIVVASLQAVPAIAVELEEVVVTAQKREQSLQDVGLTVSALSGEMLDSLGFNDSNALAASVPNLNIDAPTGEGGVSVIFIRGVGLNDFATNNSGPVGFYIDEVYTGSSNSQSTYLFDIERVEVLKGPQGTLYGRNTTGGAISVFSRRPTSEPEGYVKGSYGNYSEGKDEYKIEGVVSGPLGDGLQGRLAGVSYQSNGYMENLETGDYVEKDIWAGRGQLNWEASDRLAVLFNLHGSRNDSDADLYNSSLDDDFYKGVSDIKPKIKVDQAGGSAKVDYAINDSIDLVSITAYDGLDKKHQEDADMLPLPIVHTEYQVNADDFSQELRLVGASGDLNWIGGLYYLYEDLKQDQGVDLSGAGLPVPYVYHNKQELKTGAGFGQLEYSLTDAVVVTAGLRYTYLEVDFSTRGSGTFFLDPEAPGGVTDSYSAADSLDDDAVSGKLGLNWHISEDVMLYTSASKGFKGPGFNGNFFIDLEAISPYDSEDLYAYEVGAKSAWLDGLLQLNGAAFYYDYQHAQIFNNAPIPGLGLPSNSIRNADITLYGGDLDLTWTPLQGLYLQLGVGYTHGEYDQDIVDPVTGDLPIKGNQVQNTPEWSAFALANYEWSLGSAGYITAQVDASYSDDVYYSAFQDIAVGQKAYTLTNARLSWRSVDEKLELALWGKNLSDKEYASYVFDLRPDFGFLQRMRGVPRTVGVEARYAF